MFTRLFLRKATTGRITHILQKEGFDFSPEHVQLLLQGNQKGQRYGNIVLPRNESGTEVKRFIKIILDGTWKTYKPFRRQVLVSTALANDPNYRFPTMKVPKSSLKPPVPYVIFETREDGFMHDQPEYYDAMSDQDVTRLVELIYAFHLSAPDIDSSVVDAAVPLSHSNSHYQKEIRSWLKRSVWHKSKSRMLAKKVLAAHLDTYIPGIDVQNRIDSVWNKHWQYVTEFVRKFDDRQYLVHADMQIDNVYKHPNGSFELLDFEWVGKTLCPAIAIMYDYGNLRARAWSSPKFQKKLDAAAYEVGMNHYDDAGLVRAGIVLGRIRSGLMMCRYHMDYPHTTRNDKRSDTDYYAMFPRTVAALAEVLKDDTH